MKYSISPERLAEIAAIADDDIDTSDIPEANEEFFSKAILGQSSDGRKSKRLNGGASSSTAEG